MTRGGFRSLKSVLGISATPKPQTDLMSTKGRATSFLLKPGKYRVFCHDNLGTTPRSRQSTLAIRQAIKMAKESENQTNQDNANHSKSSYVSETSETRATLKESEDESYSSSNSEYMAQVSDTGYINNCRIQTIQKSRISEKMKTPILE